LEWQRKIRKRLKSVLLEISLFFGEISFGKRVTSVGPFGLKSVLMRKVMKQIVGPYQGNAYEDGQQYPSVSVVKMPSP
jgi:hypothetical protein